MAQRSAIPRIRPTGADFVLGTIAVLLSLVLWALYSTIQRSTPPPALERTIGTGQLGVAEQRASRVLTRYAGLSAREQDHVRSVLERTLLDVDAWLARLQHNDASILCLGENHGPSVRRFLAERFFPVYEVDALFLETSAETLGDIRRSIARERDTTPLLGADIGAVMASVQTRNPEVRFVGLEANPRGNGAEGEQSRDRAVAQRFWDHYQAGQRHVVLYGGLHCSKRNLWLYHFLQESAPPEVLPGMHSIRLAGIEQHGSVAAFARFIHLLGVAETDFIISDTATLRDESRIRQWFPLFDQQFLEPFDSIAIYRLDPPASRHASGWPVLPMPALTSVRQGKLPLTPRGDVFPHWSGDRERK